MGEDSGCNSNSDIYFCSPSGHHPVASLIGRIATRVVVPFPSVQYAAGARLPAWTINVTAGVE
jgi:hypothetical protein